MTAIARRLEAQYPNSNAGKWVAVLPLKEDLVGNTKQTLFVLLAAVSFVMLIACANVANLLLARASSRGREMAVRAAVGAGRWRLVRQLITESLTIGVLAGAAGILLARFGVMAVGALAPADLPRVDQVRVDLMALGFTVFVSLAASVIFGLAPALQVSRVQLVEGLRRGSKGGSALGARAGWARHAFVISEVALAVVLVVVAGLLGRSLASLSKVDMGFDPERLLTLRTAVPVTGPATWSRVSTFYRDVLPELRALPGVAAVGGVMSLPTRVQSNGAYVIQGGSNPAELNIQSPQAILNVVTPDYFETMRVPIRAGRDFTDGDRVDAPMVAIVNESLARRSFPGQDPIGRRIQTGLDTLEPMTIVGVVADVRTWGPARGADAEIYMPYEQHPGPANSLNLVVRADVANPLALVDTMRRLMQRKNPDVPVTGAMMEDALDVASATPRFRTFLLTVFAVSAAAGRVGDPR
jgi:predicted permease